MALDQQQTFNELVEQNNQMRDRIRQMQTELDKLTPFKKNTHLLLNEAGVPQFESEDCRVSHRIRWLRSKLDEARAACKRAELRRDDVAEQLGYTENVNESLRTELASLRQVCEAAENRHLQGQPDGYAQLEIALAAHYAKFPRKGV